MMRAQYSCAALPGGCACRQGAIGAANSGHWGSCCHPTVWLPRTGFHVGVKMAASGQCAGCRLGGSMQCGVHQARCICVVHAGSVAVRAPLGDCWQFAPQSIPPTRDGLLYCSVALCLIGIKPGFVLTGLYHCKQSCHAWSSYQGSAHQHKQGVSISKGLCATCNRCYSLASVLGWVLPVC